MKKTTNYMIVDTRKNKNVEPLEIQVKRGRIEQADKYKYLGNWMSTNGTVSEQIENIERKVEGMILEACKIGREEQLGLLSTEARLLIYERTIVPAITFNLECWTEIATKDVERMEKLQAKMLKRLLNLPKTTPYMGLLKEIGIWTLDKQLLYQRLMLYQNIITSDDERLGKQIVLDQKRQEWRKTWYSETEKKAKELGIRLQDAEEVSKAEWKKKVKTRIGKALQDEAEKKEYEMSKTRHQQGQKFERKKYVEGMGLSEASETIRRRLEMIDIGNNFGKGRKCECGRKETTEHMIECRERERTEESQIKTEWLAETDNMEIIRKVNRWIKEEIRKER